jgi:hypothetical protein
MHIFRITIVLCTLLLCVPLTYSQNSNRESIDKLFNISDPDALALALIPYLKDDNQDVRLSALANIILTKSKLTEVSQAERELLSTEPSGKFRDLLELALRISSGASSIGTKTSNETALTGDQNTGSEAPQIQGSTSEGAQAPTGSIGGASESQSKGQSGVLTSAPAGNGMLGKSAEISSGQAIDQAIAPARSSNWYKIRCDSNGILSVQVTNVPNDMRPTLDLFDKDFNHFESKASTSSGDDLKVKRDVPTPGWIYIAVADGDGKAHEEPYKLSVDFMPVQDSFDPNNVLGDAAEIQIGQSVTGSICPQREQDWFKVKADSGGIISVQVTDVPKDMRPTIDLFDKNFSHFESKAATSAGDDLKVKRDVPTPGWIYIAVADGDGKAHSEPYTLAVA